MCLILLNKLLQLSDSAESSSLKRCELRTLSRCRDRTGGSLRGGCKLQIGEESGRCSSQPKTKGWGQAQQHYSHALTQNKTCTYLTGFTTTLPSFLGSPSHPGINQSPSGHYVGFSDEEARPPPPDWLKCPGPLPICVGKGLEEKMICHPESDNSAGLKSYFPEPKGTRVEAKIAR